MPDQRPTLADAGGTQPWLVRHAGSLTIAAILFGTLCRLAQYFARISFWHDEAYIVLNVYNHGYASLLGALDLDQTAPPAFLWAVKASVALVGPNEFGFRLTPVLASILALPLFALLARKALAPAAALLALAMFCLSPKLLEHTAEVKQYSSDTLAAIVLTLIAIGPRNASAGLRLLLLAPVAAAMFWLAESPVFVFVGLVMALAPAVCRGRRRGWLCFLALAVPVVSFVILYKLSIKPQSTPFLYSYWKAGMADWHRWYLVPLWSIGRMLAVANYSYDPLGWLILPLSVLGGWRLYRQNGPGQSGVTLNAGALSMHKVPPVSSPSESPRPESAGGGTGVTKTQYAPVAPNGRELLALLAFPVVVVFLAACAGQYPMGKRVTLFLAPSLLLLAAAGLQALPAILPARARRFHPLVSAAVVCVGFTLAAWHLPVPRCESHLRPAVEFLRHNRAPHERIFVVGTNSHWIFQAYWRQDDSLITFPANLPENIRDDRFWIVFEFDPSQGMHKRLPFLQRARTLAREEKSFVGTGGAAYLFVPGDIH